jgi:CTP:molybdopterin cytidylyltransferase MocA
VSAATIERVRAAGEEWIARLRFYDTLLGDHAAAAAEDTAATEAEIREHIAVVSGNPLTPEQERANAIRRARAVTRYEASQGMLETALARVREARMDYYRAVAVLSLEES